MTLENIEMGTETVQKKVQGRGKSTLRHLPKTHVNYWFARLRKRTYNDGDGNKVEIPNWQVRLRGGGRQEWFNLGTANQATGAMKAKEIFTFWEANGWPATLAEYKPESGAAPRLKVTVGEFLDEVKAVSGLKPVTFEIYAKKFRSLVAGAFKIEGGKAKHDYVKGGYQEWLERVRSVALDKLTPDKINEWKVAELKAASKNPLLHKRASVTLRSILLCSKALFSPKIRRHLNLRLPAPLPFEGVSLPEVGKSRYKSEIEPAVILVAAKRELADGITAEDQPANPRPELFKILLLALGAGLRRDEIDKLQWKNIQWSKSAIRIETSEHGSTKSADSEADVDVDPGLLDILKIYMPKPGHGSQFVIESLVAPRPESTRNHHYRANRSFKELVAWLRSKGLTARNALHALRKEFGSQICAQAGIYAASVALRHSSINLTREYYIDKKQPAYLAISKLMQPTTEAEKGAAA
jgi:integrase